MANALSVTKGPYAPGDPSASPAGTVVLRRALLGYNLSDYVAHVITSTNTFTVKVKTNVDPAFSLPYSLYPGSGTPNAANTIVVVRGRWESIEVTTAGNVVITSDAGFEAWT